MLLRLALFLLVSTTTAAWSQSARIDRIEILESGIMRVASEVKTLQSKDISTGQRTVADAEVAEVTTTIPARNGTVFGSNMKFIGRKSDKQASLRVVWRYPEPGIRNPQTGITKTVDEYADKRNVGTTTVYHWTLGTSYTLVPGKWTLEIWQDDRRLARQDFTLVADPCGKREGQASISACSSLIKRKADDATAYFDRAATYELMDDSARALSDYAKAAELSPKDSGYARSLGVARYASGDFREAARDFRRSAELSDDLYAMLFRHLARGRTNEDGTEELQANIGRLKTKEWPYAVAELFLDKRSVTATLDAADKPDEKCEAHFYIGAWQQMKGDTTAAERELKTAAETCPRTFIESTVARAELSRLKR